MGSLLSKKDEEKLSDAINRSIHAEGKKLKNEVKLLLLGLYMCCMMWAIINFEWYFRHWGKWEEYFC